MEEKGRLLLLMVLKKLEKLCPILTPPSLWPQQADDNGNPKSLNLKAVELVNVDTGVSSLYHLAGWISGSAQIPRMVSKGHQRVHTFMSVFIPFHPSVNPLPYIALSLLIHSICRP